MVTDKIHNPVNRNPCALNLRTTASIDDASRHFCVLHVPYTAAENVSNVTLRRLPVIVAQQTTETLSPPHFAYLATDARFGGNQLIIKTLMIALLVMMRQIVMDRITQRVFTNEDHATQRFLFDRAHEALTMGIQIG